jgi:hypothetical protein
VGDWGISDVLQFIHFLGLGHVAGKFEENAVSGQDLLHISEDREYAEDFIQDLGLTKTQMSKIITSLGESVSQSEQAQAHSHDECASTTLSNAAPLGPDLPSQTMASKQSESLLVEIPAPQEEQTDMSQIAKATVDHYKSHDKSAP